MSLCPSLIPEAERPDSCSPALRRLFGLRSDPDRPRLLFAVDTRGGSITDWAMNGHVVFLTLVSEVLAFTSSGWSPAGRGVPALDAGIGWAAGADGRRGRPGHDRGDDPDPGLHGHHHGHPVQDQRRSAAGRLAGCRGGGAGRGSLSSCSPCRPGRDRVGPLFGPRPRADGPGCRSGPCGRPAVSVPAAT